MKGREPFAILADGSTGGHREHGHIGSYFHSGRGVLCHTLTGRVNGRAGWGEKAACIWVVTGDW